MRKIEKLICAGFIAGAMVSCSPPSTDLNKEDYGTRPEPKAAPTPALADIVGSGQKVPAATVTAAATTTAPAATKPAAQKGLDGQALLSKSDCLVCHKLHEKSIGPAYEKVAMKYESTDANIAMLADKVIKGGTGVWGAMPMTPHTNLPVEEVKAMVKFILSVQAE